MFKVLKIDGPNILTDKGGICLRGFQYADGGKTQPVSDEDWLKMRAGFLALPDLVAALQEVLAFIDTIRQVMGAFVSREESPTMAILERSARRALAKAGAAPNPKPFAVDKVLDQAVKVVQLYGTDHPQGLQELKRHVQALRQALDEAGV